MPRRTSCRHYQPAALLVIPFLLCGCGAGGGVPPAHTPVDLSGPKPAALTFLTALKNGDPVTAKSVSVGSESQKKWIDGYTALIRAMLEYDQALVSRFGQRATAMDIELKQALATMADDPIAGIEGGTVQEDQRSGTAQVLPGMRGIRLAARPPMYLRKTSDKQWKVDLAASADDQRHDPKVAQQYQAAADVMRAVAREVAAGRFKSVDAADAAMDERMTKVNGAADVRGPTRASNPSPGVR